MVFHKAWFKKHQRGLLFLCNTPVIKYWFRWILRIHNDLSFKDKIEELMPHYYVFGRRIILTDHLIYKSGRKEVYNPALRKHRMLKNRGMRIEKHLAEEKKYDFRTHAKFAKRIKYAFYWIWMTMHIIDWIILDRTGQTLES